jgi:hypothetical protein
MLSQGLQVLIRDNGQRESVENLKISDLIFDPVEKQYVEIIDILAREICLEASSSPLNPVTIKAGSVLPGRPSQDLLVSPAQTIVFPKIYGTAKYPIITRLAASSFAENAKDSQTAEPNRIKYFALFTENSQLMEVSGVFLETYRACIFSERDDPPSSKALWENLKSNTINAPEKVEVE